MNEQIQMHPLFPIPVYTIKRNSVLDSTEEKEIVDIIKEGMDRNTSNLSTTNKYIYNNKLKVIKQFCEKHIKNYVDEIINPEKELDLYITQSWLNVTKPHEFHHLHYHSNSIISGVFYIATVENDSLAFDDPNTKVKEMIKLEQKEFNMWNSSSWSIPVDNNKLVLFPSWLNHQVKLNPKATMDRISISFNTFVRGVLGSRDLSTELIL